MRHEKPARGASGMTLLELMVVVGIVAILASIALPAYSPFASQTNRTDATSTLQLAAQSLERCHSRTLKYTACNVNGTVVNNGSTMQTPNQFYSITFTIPDNQNYTLTALPVGAPQTSDSQCMRFMLTSTGEQVAQDVNANDSAKSCWGSS